MTLRRFFLALTNIFQRLSLPLFVIYFVGWQQERAREKPCSFFSFYQRTRAESFQLLGLTSRGLCCSSLMDFRGFFLSTRNNSLEDDMGTVGRRRIDRNKWERKEGIECLRRMLYVLATFALPVSLMCYLHHYIHTA